MKGLFSLFACFLFAGCLVPHPSDGAVKCNHASGATCPDGYFCDAPSDSCWRNGHTPRPTDMSPRDMSVNDMPVAQDLSAMEDMSSPNRGDMAIAPPDLNPGPGVAQLTIVDLEGTVPGATQTPYSHILFVTQSLPESAGEAHQKDNRVPGLGGFPFGCTADYYNAVTSFPPSEVNAGEVSYTGYNRLLASADGRGSYPSPIPGSINCDFASLGGLGTYACIYAGGTDGGVIGDNPASVIFPPLPQTGGACPSGGSTPVGSTLCEQHPFGTGISITETLAGGGSYVAAINSALIAAKPVTILTINSTGTAISPSNPYDPFAGVKLDGTHDVTLTWNCSGDVSKPAGDGCSSLDFTTLTVESNSAESLPFGIAQCVVSSKSTTSPGMLTLPKDFISTTLGGGTTGNALLLVAQLHLNPKFSGNHEVVLSGGEGYFAFLPKQ
ncbi:MAG: hypothetical protein ACHQ17_00295 [Polyangia bacterium]